MPIHCPVEAACCSSVFASCNHRWCVTMSFLVLQNLVVEFDGPFHYCNSTRIPLGRLTPLHRWTHFVRSLTRISLPQHCDEAQAHPTDGLHSGKFAGSRKFEIETRETIYPTGA